MGCPCRTRSHLSYVRRRILHYRQNWWISLDKSGNDTQPVRKRSDFNQALSTFYTKKLEDITSIPYRSGSTRNGDPHRVLLPLGGNGENPGGLPKNSKKVKKEVASKGLRSNEATRCLQDFGETSDKWLSRIHSIVSQIDRLQLTAVYCNRRCV